MALNALQSIGVSLELPVRCTWSCPVALLESLSQQITSAQRRSLESGEKGLGYSPSNRQTDF